MRIRKRWIPPPPPPPDLRSSTSPLWPHSTHHHPSLLLTTKSSISIQQDDALSIVDGEEDNKNAAFKSSTIPDTNRRNYCNPSAETSDIGGHWSEEDKIFPFKKRRILLNLDNAPISTAAKMERELKSVISGMNSMCTKMMWDDHVLKKDDDFELAAKEIGKGDNMVNSSTTRCSRSNGRGWRCSQPSFAGFCLCEHHWNMHKSRGRKDRKKKKKIKKKHLIPPKFAASKDDAVIIIDRKEEKDAAKRNSRIAATKNFCNPIAETSDDSSISSSVFHQKGPIKKRRVLNLDSTSTILQREPKNVNARAKSSKMIWGDNFLNKDEHHWALSNKTSRKESKNNKNKSIPSKFSSSRVQITPSSFPTLLRRERKNIVDARTKVMNSDTAAKKIRMTENMRSNKSTGTRCICKNGIRWRCSLPSLAGYTVCEHHLGYVSEYGNTS